MKTLLFKELRDLLPFAALVAVFAGADWAGEFGRSMSFGPPTGRGFRELARVSIAAGILFAFAQRIRDLATSSDAYLRHRGVAQRAQFRARAMAGVVAALLVPLGCVGFAVKIGLGEAMPNLLSWLSVVESIVAVAMCPLAYVVASWQASRVDAFGLWAVARAAVSVGMTYGAWAALLRMGTIVPQPYGFVLHVCAELGLAAYFWRLARRRFIRADHRDHREGWLREAAVAVVALVMGGFAIEHATYRTRGWMDDAQVRRIEPLALHEDGRVLRISHRRSAEERTGLEYVVQDANGHDLAVFDQSPLESRDITPVNGWKPLGRDVQAAFERSLEDPLARKRICALRSSLGSLTTRTWVPLGHRDYRLDSGFGARASVCLVLPAGYLRIAFSRFDVPSDDSVQASMALSKLLRDQSYAVRTARLPNGHRLGPDTLIVDVPSNELMFDTAVLFDPSSSQVWGIQPDKIEHAFFPVRMPDSGSIVGATAVSHRRNGPARRPLATAALLDGSGGIWVNGPDGIEPLASRADYVPTSELRVEAPSSYLQYDSFGNARETVLDASGQPIHEFVTPASRRLTTRSRLVRLTSLAMEVPLAALAGAMESPSASVHVIPTSIQGNDWRKWTSAGSVAALGCILGLAAFLVERRRHGRGAHALAWTAIVFSFGLWGLGTWIAVRCAPGSPTRRRSALPATPMSRPATAA